MEPEADGSESFPVMGPLVLRSPPRLVLSRARIWWERLAAWAPLGGALAGAIMPFCDSGAYQDTPLLLLGLRSARRVPLMQGLEAVSQEGLVVGSCGVSLKPASVSSSLSSVVW